MTLKKPAFCPSHRITLRSGEVEVVMLVDGAAYTAEEWATNSMADYECDEDGRWTFQGEAFDCTVKEMPSSVAVEFASDSEEGDCGG